MAVIDEQEGTAVELVPTDSVQPHPRNVRRGDVPKIKRLILQGGWHGSVLVQRSTGHVLVGNHRWRALRELQQEAGVEDPRVPVEWFDGTEEEALAKLLGDNNASDSATNDPDLLAELLGELSVRDQGLAGTGYDPSDLDELLLSLRPDEPQPRSDGRLLELADVTMDEPTHDPSHGDVWNVGGHVLVVADVLTEWALWSKYLEGDSLFVPYPGPYAALTMRADERRLVMVQPDPYLAGHLLDKFAAVRGDDTVAKA